MLLFYSKAEKELTSKCYEFLPKFVEELYSMKMEESGL